MAGSETPKTPKIPEAPVLGVLSVRSGRESVNFSPTQDEVAAPRDERAAIGGGHNRARPHPDDWADEWLAFRDERAGIAEFDGGLPRAASPAHLPAVIEVSLVGAVRPAFEEIDRYPKGEHGKGHH